MKKLFLLSMAAIAVFGCSSTPDDPTDPTDPNDPNDPDAKITLSVTSGHEHVKEGNNLYFPVDGGVVTFKVSSESEWHHEVSLPWFTTVESGDQLTLVAPENTTGETKTATLTFFAGEGKNYYSVVYNIFQSAFEADIFTDETAEIPGDGGEVTLDVVSTHEWDIEYDSKWLKAEKSGNNKLVLSAEDNPDDERTATVKIFTTEEEFNYAEFTITVTQGNNGLEMIFELTIPSGASTGNPVTARLPISSWNGMAESNANYFKGTIDCYVDWGDGSEPEHVTSDLPTHDYTESGVFDVVVSGTVECLVASTTAALGWTNDQRELITAVKQWGQTNLINLWSAFQAMPNLKTVATDKVGSFKEVTHLYHMFYNCTGLEAIPQGIFDYAAKNTTCRYMFSGCELIESIPDGLFASMPLVENFENMFANCRSIKTIGQNILGQHENATTIMQFFYNCELIETIPEGIFDGLPNIVTCNRTFAGCKALKTVPVSLFDNCTKITTFYQMFDGDDAIVGESPYSVIGGTKIHLYERSEYTSYFESPTTFGACFRNTSFSDYDDIPSTWK